MKIAWLTHRQWDPDIGGAEAVDLSAAMNRPEGTEITVIWPGGVDENLLDYDRIVVTGFYGFSSRELNFVQDVGHKTILWLHDSQMTSHWLYTVVGTLIFGSPQHQEFELKNQPGFEPKRTFINPGYMDVDEVYAGKDDLQFGERENALWAHRPVAHKGLDLAVEWAKENDVILDVLVGRPRQQVLRAMAQHRYFVLLSHIFDASPRAVIEAQLLGCELVISDNVGWFDEPIPELRDRVSRANDEFWEAVLS